MSKVAVIFWSGTGNTEAMANAIAFGCTCMGSEQLEDGEFEPMWDSVKNDLGSKSVYLFGSYGYGGRVDAKLGV